MAIMSSGNDEETRVARRRGVRPGQSDPAPEAPAGAGPSSDTRILSQKEAAAGAGGGSRDRTILHRHGQPSAADPEQSPAAAQPAGATAQGFDPAVGWLVVLQGPGRGASLTIFEGMNTVGRDPGQRIPINFGDGKISREAHFFLTFEPKKRTFHVNHGGKGNLVYLNGEVLLAPMLLKNGDVIEVGVTKLRFVPLCGEDFGWDT
jgi:FHA domain-containing protein